MQKSGIFSKIKTPILIGGLFSAFVYMYFTPNFAHASTSFLMLFTDPQKIFFVGAMLVGLFLADTGTKIKKHTDMCVFLFYLVALVGLEPTLLAELDFESSASTNSATGPKRNTTNYFVAA